MKQSVFFAAALALIVAGCKQPNEIELGDDLQFDQVEDAQQSLERPSIDSTAILPKDQDVYAGQMYINAVKTKSFRGTEAVAFSRVIFEDRLQSVLDSARIRRGFSGMRIGAIRLNGEFMGERQRRIANIGAGFDYVKDLSTTHAPRRRYTWQVSSPLNLGSFEATIDAPDEMDVTSPAGGTTISRNQDLELKWTGRGDVFIIVSALRSERISPDLSKQITQPLFSCLVTKEGGRVRVSKKVLKALPPAEAYVFTFVRLNRKEISNGRFNGRVLVQASSIYNSIVALQ